MSNNDLTIFGYYRDAELMLGDRKVLNIKQNNLDNYTVSLHSTVATSQNAAFNIPPRL